MLKVTGANFNIGSNRSAEMKTESGMMQQDLTIPPNLLRIFSLVILINLSPENLRLAKVKGKEVNNQELSSIIYSRDFASQQGANLMILTFLMMLITFILILYYSQHIFV